MIAGSAPAVAAVLGVDGATAGCGEAAFTFMVGLQAGSCIRIIGADVIVGVTSKYFNM
jgi:hypothetical protein